VCAGASTPGGAIVVEVGITPFAGASADISSSAALSIGFADKGWASTGGTASAWFVLGLAARNARLPFDCIPMILVCLSRALIAPHKIKIDRARYRDK
jgi:hypothetical protein